MAESTISKPIIIRRGTASFGAVSTTGQQSINVSFGMTFPSIPTVTATWNENIGTVADYANELIIGNISTTGFTAYTKRINPSYTWRFQWIAVCD
jgi:hypothetical protein